MERRQVVEKHEKWGWLGLKQSGQAEASRPLSGMIVIRPKVLTIPISEVENEVQKTLAREFDGQFVWVQPV